jgi:multidrug efflux pump subunit AcrB
VRGLDRRKALGDQLIDGDVACALGAGHSESDDWLVELGTVTDGAAEPRTFTRLFDQPIVAFGVTRAKGASDVTVDKLIAKRLSEIEAAHPEVRFTKVDTQVDSELGNYHSTMETLIEGALLAVVVVVFFLRDLRATLVTAVALPLSVIPTFWAMDAIGF